MLKRFVTYSISLYAAALFAGAVGIVAKSLIAKMAGKEALGIYSYLISLVTVGSAVLAFGLGRALAKYVAERRNGEKGEVVGGILALLVFLSIALAAAGLVVWRYMDPVYALALVAVGPFTFFQLTRAILRGELDRNREAPAAFLNALARLLLVWLCISLFGGIWSPAVGLVLACVGVAILSLAYFVKLHPEWWRLAGLSRTYRQAEFMALLGLAAPLWMSDLLAIVGQQADRLLIQGQLGYSVLAEYSAAFSLILLVDQPITVMSRMYLVTFARGFYTEMAQFRRIVAINLAVIPGAALVVVALAEPLTRVLFAPDYTLVPALVAVLSIGLVTKSTEVLNSALTIARDYPQANRNAKLGITIVYVPALFFLVSRYGAYGAAWSYVLSWVGYAFLHMANMRRRLPEQAAYSTRLTLAGLVLYCIMLGAMQLSSLGVLSLLFALLYLGSGHLLRLWDLRDGVVLSRQLIRSYSPGKGLSN